MSHFAYPHLPAIGLGVRDPRRPHVTGGLGEAIPIQVFITVMSRLLWAIIINDRLTGTPALTTGSGSIGLDDDDTNIDLTQTGSRVIQLDDR